MGLNTPHYKLEKLPIGERTISEKRSSIKDIGCMQLFNN